MATVWKEFKIQIDLEKKCFLVFPIRCDSERLSAREQRRAWITRLSEGSWMTRSLPKLAAQCNWVLARLTMNMKIWCAGNKKSASFFFLQDCATSISVAYGLVVTSQTWKQTLSMAYIVSIQRYPSLLRTMVYKKMWSLFILCNLMTSQDPLLQLPFQGSPLSFYKKSLSKFQHYSK